MLMVDEVTITLRTKQILDPLHPYFIDILYGWSVPNLLSRNGISHLSKKFKNEIFYKNAQMLPKFPKHDKPATKPW